MEGITALFICLTLVAPLYTYVIIEILNDDMNL